MKVGLGGTILWLMMRLASWMKAGYVEGPALPSLLPGCSRLPARSVKKRSFLELKWTVPIQRADQYL